MLRRRLDRAGPVAPEAPIFASRTGIWLNPSSLGTGLRRAISQALARGTPADLELGGVTHAYPPTDGRHTGRHEVSLDDAREQLGHRDPSVTCRHYVGKRPEAPDLRQSLDPLLATLDQD